MLGLKPGVPSGLSAGKPVPLTVNKLWVELKGGVTVNSLLAISRKAMPVTPTISPMIVSETFTSTSSPVIPASKIDCTGGTGTVTTKIGSISPLLMRIKSSPSSQGSPLPSREWVGREVSTSPPMLIPLAQITPPGIKPLPLMVMFMSGTALLFFAVCFVHKQIIPIDARDDLL